MLSSGRLGKGSFQEVTDEMNKRCNMQESFEIFIINDKTYHYSQVRMME